MEWPNTAEGPVRTNVDTTSQMWCDKDKFYTQCEMKVTCNDIKIFSKIWNKEYNRNNV